MDAFLGFLLFLGLIFLGLTFAILIGVFLINALQG